MSVTRIATRYAKSLLDLAIDQDKVEAVTNDMRTLQQAVKHRDLYVMLKSPIISAERKQAVLEALFQGKLDPLMVAYLRLLIQKGREGYVPEITFEFLEQYKSLRGVTSVRVTSAAPLSDSVLAEIRQHLAGTGVVAEKVEIETLIDPELIGGFILEYNNKRYDASAAHKLGELKAQFSKNLYIKEF